MSAAKVRVWKKIVVFYALTLLFSALFELLDRRAPGNVILITGVMWCPGLAALLTKRLFGESVRDLGWSWGSGRYQVWAYLIPLLYALPVYLVVWSSGLGGFYDADFVAKAAKEYGLSDLSIPAALIGYVLLSMSAGFIPKTARALGEEIGWRGFLVPELAKVTNFAGVGLISGLMWAAWHYPSILFSNYNEGTPAWYALVCFTVMVVSSGFIAAWLRLRSGSVWPAAIYHGAHNMFIQLIFTPLTTNTGNTAWYIDEFGAGLAIASLIGAIIVWRKRDELPVLDQA
ncbi:MAG TPA: CPBP family intramembrane glutamic endopeptidase [Rudaea sp.]|jgi:membrane protease YdiL (CAAX protease family)|uniref:CPBP family intramembrane glutamic endopeptidase n=1 Tax=Rudaea sp. TaxID=2136325 RepID=UPI002F95DCD3